MQKAKLRTLGHKVPPRSRQSIENLAHFFRDRCNFSNTPSLPILEFLELMSNEEVINLEVVEDHELGEDEARAFPDKLHIQVKQSVYEGAIKGLGHCRFTLAHEFGHLLLHKNIPQQYARSNSQHKVFEDSEWQADVFAGAVLIDRRQTTGLETEDEIAKKFNVSNAAAASFLRQIKSPKSDNF